MDYNSIATAYHEFGDKATTDWEFGYKHEEKLLQPLENKNILDFGCGDGKFCRYLAERGANVTGFDTSFKMIDLAQSQPSSNINYIQAQSLQQAGLQNESFDAAVVNFVFCTCETKSIIKNALNEIHRLLKKGGFLLVLNCNWDECNGLDFLSHKLIKKDNLQSGDNIQVVLKNDPPLTITDYFWSIEDYQDMLNEAGFTNLEIIKAKAKEDDARWLNERHCAPITIIKATVK